MARITPLRRDGSKDLETVFEITEAVMGFVPNSMLIMARDPGLLAAFPSFPQSLSRGRAGSIRASRR